MNPCLERNYIANNHEEETKNLIMGSVKDKSTRRPAVMVSATPLPHAVAANAAVGRRNHVQPIPFLQNNIHAAAAASPRRKNNNVNVEKADRVAGLDHPR